MAKDRLAPVLREWAALVCFPATSQAQGQCKRRFVVTPYPLSQSGVREPVMPTQCPFGGDGAQCSVGKHSRRERASGPGFALVVAVCRAHARYFTLYPPGWVPYARVPVARPRCKGWQRTLFGAAVLAAKGEIWPENSVAAPGCAVTQRRRIARCGAWLGLRGQTADFERAALALQVPLHRAQRARDRFALSRRRERGAAIVALLEAMAEDEAVLWRLLALGVELGVCGRAYRCDESGVLHPVFRGQNDGSGSVDSLTASDSMSLSRDRDAETE